MNPWCTKCKRRLKNPKSVINGMGPVCYAKSQWEKAAENNHQVLLDVPTDDVILRRTPSGIATNVPRRWVYHSPTGFEWGYGGSGPADLALNILLKFGVPKEAAERLHQKFKFDVVCRIPREGAVIPAADVRQWIADHPLKAIGELV